MNFRKGSVIVDFVFWMESTPQGRIFVLRTIIKNIDSFTIGGHYVDIMSVIISGMSGTDCTLNAFVIVRLLISFEMSS